MWNDIIRYYSYLHAKFYKVQKLKSKEKKNKTI